MGDIGIIDLTFILDAEDVIEGDVPIRIKHVRYVFGP